MWQLYRIPNLELADRFYAAPDVLGSAVQELWLHLADCTSFNQRVAAAERFLSERTARAAARTPIMNAAVQIFERSGSVRVHQIAAGSALSVRHFERPFTEQTGIPPKLLARITRFQHALDARLRDPRRSWLRIAHDLGYFDQMHMVRDFHSLSGDSPSQIFSTFGDPGPPPRRRRQPSLPHLRAGLLTPRPKPLTAAHVAAATASCRCPQQVAEAHSTSPQPTASHQTASAIAQHPRQWPYHRHHNVKPIATLPGKASMPAEQNLKNHTRVDPPFHFFVMPMLLLNFVLALYTFVHRWPAHPHIFGWWVIMSVVLLVAGSQIRTNSLKVQDRVIRLEELLRFSTILPEPERTAANRLTLRQIVALRFASDAELPTLVRRALAEDLAPKQIKAAIATWRADHLRV